MVSALPLKVGSLVYSVRHESLDMGASNRQGCVTAPQAEACDYRVYGRFLILE